MSTSWWSPPTTTRARGSSTEPGVDAILVGDSLGMVVQGHDSTLPVTLDDVVYHTRCVTRAKPRAHVVADLPFGTFQRGPAGRTRRGDPSGAGGRSRSGEGRGCQDRAGGHREGSRGRHPGVGASGADARSPSTPSVAIGCRGARPRPPPAGVRGRAGRRAAGAALWSSSACPDAWPPSITAAASIPTIGIGAGVHCDGQVLVFHDLLGLRRAFQPRFVKRLRDAPR